MFRTMSELKAANKKLGHHWFERGTMRFFNTRIESQLYGGRYFITSETMDPGGPRSFSIREASADGSIDTVGKFQGFRFKEDARDEIRRLLKVSGVKNRARPGGFKPRESELEYLRRVHRALRLYGVVEPSALTDEYASEVREGYASGLGAVALGRRLGRRFAGIHEANRARSPARSRLGKKALPKSSEERVASLRDLGGYDAGAFYSVKGGKLLVRQRKAGKGLGAARSLGSLPGFRKGLFYFVKKGVVYARSRRK